MEQSALIALTVCVAGALLVTLVLVIRELRARTGTHQPGGERRGKPVAWYTLEAPPRALEGKGERLRSLAVPCVALETYPAEEPLPPLASKLGGTPGLADPGEWPRTSTGAAMTFLGQINFLEVAGILSQVGGSPPEELPSRGLLLFFYDMEKQVWGFDPDDHAGWRCIWRPEPEEPTGELPLPEQAQAPRPCGLSCAPAWSLPASDEERADLGDLDEQEEDAYFELLSDVQPHPTHQLLGYPAPIQGDPRFEAQMGSNGVYCGDRSVREHPRYQELVDGVRDWRLLWQIDSDDAAGWMWGDAGMLYLLIRKEDLAASHLDRIWVVSQCC